MLQHELALRLFLFWEITLDPKFSVATCSVLETQSTRHFRGLPHLVSIITSWSWSNFGSSSWHGQWANVSGAEMLQIAKNCINISELQTSSDLIINFGVWRPTILKYMKKTNQDMPSHVLPQISHFFRCQVSSGRGTSCRGCSESLPRTNSRSTYFEGFPRLTQDSHPKQQEKNT